MMIFALSPMLNCDTPCWVWVFVYVFFKIMVHLNDYFPLTMTTNE